MSLIVSLFTANTFVSSMSRGGHHLRVPSVLRRWSRSRENLAPQGTVEPARDGRYDGEDKAGGHEKLRKRKPQEEAATPLKERPRGFDADSAADMSGYGPTTQYNRPMQFQQRGFRPPNEYYPPEFQTTYPLQGPNNGMMPSQAPWQSLGQPATVWYQQDAPYPPPNPSANQGSSQEYYNRTGPYVQPSYERSQVPYSQTSASGPSQLQPQAPRDPLPLTQGPSPPPDQNPYENQYFPPPREPPQRFYCMCRRSTHQRP